MALQPRSCYRVAVSHFPPDTKGMGCILSMSWRLFYSNCGVPIRPRVLTIPGNATVDFEGWTEPSSVGQGERAKAMREAGRCPASTGGKDEAPGPRCRASVTRGLPGPWGSVRLPNGMPRPRNRNRIRGESAEGQARRKGRVRRPAPFAGLARRPRQPAGGAREGGVPRPPSPGQRGEARPPPPRPALQSAPPPPFCPSPCISGERRSFSLRCRFPSRCEGRTRRWPAFPWVLTRSSSVRGGRCGARVGLNAVRDRGWFRARPFGAAEVAAGDTGCAGGGRPGSGARPQRWAGGESLPLSPGGETRLGPAGFL